MWREWGLVMHSRTRQSQRQMRSQRVGTGPHRDCGLWSMPNALFGEKQIVERGKKIRETKVKRKNRELFKN